MKRKEYLWIFYLLSNVYYPTRACTIDGVNWNFPIVAMTVIDTDRGEIRRLATTGISSIISSSHTGEALNRGPYIVASLEDDYFIISLHENFDLYEEYETRLSMGFQIQFSCGGPLTLSIAITDTNNNPPTFLPTDQLEFSVVPPLPPGFLITGCTDIIIVRDIDLTTQRIEFNVIDNPYFEIYYDSDSSVANSKNFNGILRTTSFIRSIPEPIFLQITATDVDQTAGPPITTTAIVRIEGSSDFVLPDELIFSETFYLARYSIDNQVTLSGLISLQQGFDSEVSFRLSGDLENHFMLIGTGNQRSIALGNELPQEVLNEQTHVLLIVHADRVGVNNATSTIIIELPEAISLEFDKLHYEGSITDNIFNSPELILTQGFEDGFTIQIDTDYELNFNYVITDDNIITLTMTSLGTNVTQENNFITLQVTATSATSSTKALVTLDIIKDDLTTPIFENSLYIGAYDIENGLQLEDIILSQGYDNSVTYEIDEDQGQYFEIFPNDNRIIVAANIPLEILYNERNLLFTIQANKPRTVGARVTVAITLPSDLQTFSRSHYLGELDRSPINLNIYDEIIFTGYDADVNFILEGEMFSYFNVSNINSRVYVTLNTDNEITADVIGETKLITLELKALKSFNVISSTIIVIDIANEEILPHPVFREPYYEGSYREVDGLQFSHNIELEHGYNEDVQFFLDGDHADWFVVIGESNSRSIAVIEDGIPKDVIDNNQYVTFSIVALSSELQTGRATIIIALPKEDIPALRFDQTFYQGELENGNLNIPGEIILHEYEIGTDLSVTGELRDHFHISNIGSMIILNLNEDNMITDEAISVLDFIVLEITAESPTGESAAATVIIDVKKEVDPIIIHPLFSESYYEGSYTLEHGLEFNEDIELEEGYSDAVEFDTKGDHGQWFTVIGEGNTRSIAVADSGIPTEVIANDQYLSFSILAILPGVRTGRATIIISLPKEEAAVLQFDQSHYQGELENNILNIHGNILLQEYEFGTELSIAGELREHFTINNDGGLIILGVNEDNIITDDVLRYLDFIVLEIKAERPTGESATAVVIIDVKSEDDPILYPLFGQSHYEGSYTIDIGLDFDHNIELDQGYSESIAFDTEGDHGQWFTVIGEGNTRSIAVADGGIPTEVIANNQYLSFSILAILPGVRTGRATIIIALPKEEAAVLQFDQSHYQGELENNILNIHGNILLQEYEIGTELSIAGELGEHFTINNDGGLIILGVNEDNIITDDVLRYLDFIVLEIKADRLTGESATAVVIIDVKSEDDPIPYPLFGQSHYEGSYTIDIGLDFDHNIELDQGYSESIAFDTEGDHGQWFTVIGEGNTRSIVVADGGIPTEVIANNQYLSFSILAILPGVRTGRATIIIALPKEEAAVLQFDQSHYQGELEKNILNMHENILLQEYEFGTELSIAGELREHFTINNDGGLIILGVNEDNIITDDVLRYLDFIVLEIKADRPTGESATAVVIIDVKSEDDPIPYPLFGQSHYEGSYTIDIGLDFDHNIELDQGYSESIAFDTEGDHGQWFTVIGEGNTRSIAVADGGIPTEVIANNQYLSFSILAILPGVRTGRATIIIALPKEEAAVLQFDQSHYQGELENNILNIHGNILLQEYEFGTELSIAGELREHFTINNDGGLIILGVNEDNIITDDVLRYLDFIVLEIKADRPTGESATAVVIIDVKSEDDPIPYPLFGQSHYEGSYTIDIGLDFDHNIELDQGYSESIAFDTEGDHGQWFTVIGEGNTRSIAVADGGIPTEVIANNQYLSFSILAILPGVRTGRATIIIALPKEEAAVLQFDQSHYQGELENNILNIHGNILLQEYEFGTELSIAGELREHFTINNDGGLIILSVNEDNIITDDVLRYLDFIVLEIKADRPTGESATAVVIIDVKSEDDPIPYPLFGQSHYEGSYTIDIGLDFDHNIELDQGYSESIAFETEGDHGQWFTVIGEGNTRSIAVADGGIPTEVIANNQYLSFSILAILPGVRTGRATIIIALPKEEAAVLQFDQSHYQGELENNILNIHGNILLQEYEIGTELSIAGELGEHFTINNDGGLIILGVNEDNIITDDVLRYLDFIVLEIKADRLTGESATAVVIIDVKSEDDPIPYPLFGQSHYEGSYTIDIGLDFDHNIELDQGYSESIAFDTEGDHGQWFTVIGEGNTRSIAVADGGIPTEVIANNQYLSFSILAILPGVRTGRATIIIALPKEEAAVLQFDQSHYQGELENNILNIHGNILLQEYEFGTELSIAGELREHFTINNDGGLIILSVNEDNIITDDVLRYLDFIVLEIKAERLTGESATAVVIIDVKSEDDPIPYPLFGQSHYEGSYTIDIGLDFDHNIELDQGYSESIAFDTEGDHGQWFTVIGEGNTRSIAVADSGIPTEVIANNQYLSFSILAVLPGVRTGRATIIIALLKEEAAVLQFDQSHYLGELENNILNIHGNILLQEYEIGTELSIAGEFREHFTINNDEDLIILSINEDNIITDDILRYLDFIVLEIKAEKPTSESTTAVVIIDVKSEDDLLSYPVFSESHYEGSYTIENGLDFDHTIELEQGYNDLVEFRLNGEHSELFTIVGEENRRSIAVNEDGISSEIIANNTHLTFSMLAIRTGVRSGRTAIIISLSEDPVYFDEAIYRGVYELGLVEHDHIKLIGFSGTTVEIIGEYSDLFNSSFMDEQVTIVMTNGNIPREVNHVAFELLASPARAALVIEIRHLDETIPPSIEFSSSSYEFRIDVTQTGVIGIVQATTSNDESLIYSLQVDNDHLSMRLSVNAQGEINLSAPANTGQYNFNIIARAVVSDVYATAAAYMTVDAITICGEDNRVVPPLIIIERDEEEPHENIVVLDNEQSVNCWYTMTGRWPTDQALIGRWLTIDERGLHANTIDREHETIAFMALSQVQVELILHCSDDSKRRTTRAALYEDNITRSDALGPYDYGTNRWILTDTIYYNSRRSFVNLIVRDINDNYPIFIGKENEPLVFGYPIPELIDVVSPRAFAELKATDADVGENAQIVYWSDENKLAVASESGKVHVRNNARYLLEQGEEFVINATDRFGAADGLTGSIRILVRLLNLDNIVVMSIPDAFLDDENNILSNLTTILGYDIKILRSTVISDDGESSNLIRNRRETEVKTSSRSRREGGATLQLYVYGLNDTIPVTANQLIDDININDIHTVLQASTKTLEDHIDEDLNCPVSENNIGLFVSTIILSILLFLLIIFIVCWYFFKIRKENNYDSFSDTNSLTSKDESLMTFSRPENITRPKVNIEEIKKSEKRLQEILNAPFDQNVLHPNQSVTNVTSDTVVDIIEIDKPAPIIIQSIDKLKNSEDTDEEDEFGETKNTNNRKSVVTFNENVEKIIHVEDDIDETESVPDYEVNKL